MTSSSIRIPEATRRRLDEFRRQVRKVKIAEGVLGGLFGLTLSYVAVFVLDRFVDTPGLVRIAILAVGCLGFAVFFPLKCHRWVWGTRRMEQVATLLKHRFPALGDQLLSVVELSREDSNLGTSETLARAAVEHVDAAVRDRDFSDAVPQQRHKTWAAIAAGPVLLMILAMATVPAAGWNALQRWLMPWQDVDRYTFAQVEELPPQIVVPHGEEFPFIAQLSPDTQWTPGGGSVHFNEQSPVDTELNGDRYEFRIPPQMETGTLQVRIGDIRESVDVHVATRPELNSMTASITLPDYLQYSRDLLVDARSGVVSLLKGSVADFSADISRDLQSATVRGSVAKFEGSRILAEAVLVADSEAVEFQWTDELGLTAKDSFMLKIKAVDDAEPGVSVQQLDPRQVVLSTEVISFDIQADDDYGVKEVGVEWRGVADPLRNPNPETGDKIVSIGQPEQTALSSQATFCALSDNVRAQTLEIRAYAEDFKPERGRSYSPTCLIHVMTPEEHAIWIKKQLRRWASLADDVYEEEMRLHDANRELRRMDSEQLDETKTRRRVEQQAAAERANAQRLGAITDHGDQLIRQAMRNPEMLVGHLETWATALEKLKQIGEHRMPSVAELLASAASARKPPSGKSSEGQSKTAPTAGNNRSGKAGEGGESEPGEKQPAAVPKLTDVESGFMKSDEEDDDEEKKEDPAKGGKSRLTLPTTVLHGGPKQDSEPCPPQESVDEAVGEQADLLADFAKVRADLQKIMDDLENSTFVKRLKAASRRQMEVAADLNRTLFKGFGLDASKLDDRQNTQVEKIAEREEAQSQSIWTIQSDLEAYYERRQEPKFLRVIAQMEETKVTSMVTGIGARVRRNFTGEGISRSEFWCDTLDRWAEELVEPAPGGS
ncbi:MAG: hypothetical protein GY903_16800 [Fuerstiella sp.]|nr:hypothetical protein [Fuerstiella sp.]MCP4856143.1 hypothetical protein [Fuerstiella sp.]